jgi:hypothetical protein
VLLPLLLLPLQLLQPARAVSAQPWVLPLLLPLVHLPWTQLLACAQV